MWGSLGKLRTPRTCGTCEQAEESWCDCESGCCETEGTWQPHCVRPHHSPPGTGSKPQDPRERTERCIKQVTKAVQLAFLGKGLERAKVYGGRLLGGCCGILSRREMMTWMRKRAVGIVVSRQNTLSSYQGLMQASL